MTSSTECSRMRISLGVYVLGAIEPAERSTVDAHLNVCQRCRDELASLAGLPAMLGRITEDQIEQLTPPPDGLLDSILATAVGETRGRRRKNRLLLVAAAAALVVATGVGVGAVTENGGGGTVAEPPVASPSITVGPTLGPATTVTGNDPMTGVKARIGLKPKKWGTALSVRLTGAPLGVHCRLVLINKRGNTDFASSWEVEYVGSANFEGSSMFQKSDIASIEVRTLEGIRLLRVQL